MYFIWIKVLFLSTGGLSNRYLVPQTKQLYASVSTVEFIH